MLSLLTDFYGHRVYRDTESGYCRIWFPHSGFVKGEIPEVQALVAAASFFYMDPETAAWPALLTQFLSPYMGAPMPDSTSNSSCICQLCGRNATAANPVAFSWLGRPSVFACAQCRAKIDKRSVRDDQEETIYLSTTPHLPIPPNEPSETVPTETRDPKIELGQIWRVRGGFNRLRVTSVPTVDGIGGVCVEWIDREKSFEYTQDWLRVIAWLEDSEPLISPDTRIVPGEIWHNTGGGPCNILIRVVRLIRRNDCDFVGYEDMREHTLSEMPKYVATGIGGISMLIGAVMLAIISRREKI